MIHLVQHIHAARVLSSLQTVQAVLHITVLVLQTEITYSTVYCLLQVGWVPCQASEGVFQIHHDPSLAIPLPHYQHQIVVCLHPSYTISHPFHSGQQDPQPFTPLWALCCRLQANKRQKTEVG